MEEKVLQEKVLQESAVHNNEYEINKIDSEKVFSEINKTKKKRRKKIEITQESTQKNNESPEKIQFPSVSELLQVPLFVLNQYLIQYNITPLSEEEKILLVDATDKLLQYYNFEVTPPTFFLIVVSQITIPRLIQYLNNKKMHAHEQNNTDNR